MKPGPQHHPSAGPRPLPGSPGVTPQRLLCPPPAVPSVPVSGVSQDAAKGRGRAEGQQPPVPPPQLLGTAAHHMHKGCGPWYSLRASVSPPGSSHVPTPPCLLCLKRSRPCWGRAREKGAWGLQDGATLKGEEQPPGSRLSNSPARPRLLAGASLGLTAKSETPRRAGLESPARGVPSPQHPSAATAGRARGALPRLGLLSLGSGCSTQLWGPLPCLGVLCSGSGCSAQARGALLRCGVLSLGLGYSPHVWGALHRLGMLSQGSGCSHRAWGPLPRLEVLSPGVGCSP